MARALIVVDMQLDFCPGGRLAVAGGDEIVAGINDLMADFDAVVLTQDWHPRDHASFADNHPGAAAYSVVDMAYGPQVLWPAHCVIGTEGAGFHPALAADCADLVIRKGFRPQIDSYSAFFETTAAPPPALPGTCATAGWTSWPLSGWRRISASPGRPSTRPGWAFAPR